MNRISTTFSLDGVSRLTTDALLKATESSLDIAQEKIFAIPAKEVAALLASAFAGKFATDLVIACLRAIIAEDKTSLLVKLTEKLVKNPLRTGMDVLTVAMNLEPSDGVVETEEQRKHREERYRDALRCFDSAFQNADDSDKPAIDFLRGLATMRIPGARGEAALHFSAFRQSCGVKATTLRQQAQREEELEQSRRIKAEAITG